MASKIILISDDSNFFDYIKPKLELRKSDELFMYNFDSIPNIIHHIENSLLIVNSENAKEKTLDFLNLFNYTPIIVFSFNEDDIYRRKCYRAGAFNYLTLLTPDAEFRARIIPALSICTLLEKKNQFRNILVSNNIINPDNDVYIDYNQILDKELELINKDMKTAVFVAISPNEKSKFLIQAKIIEAVILNNIRHNDILINYAPNKYFLIMFDTNIQSAQMLWNKITTKLPEKLYAGFCMILNQKRQQLINEALNKLHLAINSDKDIQTSTSVNLYDNVSNYTNFKLYRKDFEKKVDKIVTPAFYQVQQKYLKEFKGIMLEQQFSNGTGNFTIKDKSQVCSFKITTPGFAKINIDITCQKDNNIIDTKRISLEPEELEGGLIEDLLEQFITEYKKGYKHDA